MKKFNIVATIALFMTLALSVGCEKKMDDIKAQADEAAEKVEKVAKDGKEVVKDGAEKVGEVAKDGAAVVKDGAEKVGEVAKDGAEAVKKEVKDAPKKPSSSN